MTDDQHKVIDEKLKNEGFTNIKFDKNTAFCDCLVEGHIINLRCVLSSTFPYELPTVYIAEDCYRKFAPLPHINDDFSICTFDKSTVIPNFKVPYQVIVASFVQARLVIHQGIKKENIEDFYEEFNAYWHLECDGIAESFICATDTIQKIKCFISDKKVFLAENMELLDTYLGNMGIMKRYLEDYYDGIYLPLNIKLCPPFPKSNYELFKLIKSDTSAFNAYRKFVQSKIPQGAFIAFSLPGKGRRYIQLWMHTRISTMVRGFRKGHIPVGIAYLNDNKKTPLLKYYVQDLSQERLFTRGGTGIIKGISKVAVIGCGSIGSYMIEALSEYGVAAFLLVDNETLSAENIARHYCGYEYLGVAKVSAICSKLCNHNPNIDIKAYNENGISFIEKHLDKLNECDIIIVATASAPLEYRMIEMANERKIRKPIMLTWVEPLLAAGHALILHKPQDVFNELFDSNFSFSRKVVSNSGDFLTKESGCQSTFIPYAAFTLKRYIYTLLDYLVYDNIQKGKDGNYLITWCGDLSSAQKEGCRISLSWKDADNYSLHIKRID